MESRTKQFIKRLLAVPHLPEKAIDIVVDFVDEESIVKKTKTIVVGGLHLDIPEGVFYEIRALLLKGLKIQAIKMLKAKTGYGLKDAKEAIDDKQNFNM